MWAALCSAGLTVVGLAPAKIHVTPNRDNNPTSLKMATSMMIMMRELHNERKSLTSSWDEEERTEKPVQSLSLAALVF